jgi:protein-tyrosine phosphatase
MIELYPRLYVGDQSTCLQGFDGLAVVHACKSPCHQRAVDYRLSLPPDHRHYLAFENLHNLYLNLIDPPTPLFRVESFQHFRDFAASAYVESQQALLIHCNQGQSRAPMLAMLFLAKDLHALPDDSYAAAVEAFQRASCNLTDPFIEQV